MVGNAVLVHTWDAWRQFIGPSADTIGKGDIDHGGGVVLLASLIAFSGVCYRFNNGHVSVCGGSPRLIPLITHQLGPPEKCFHQSRIFIAVESEMIAQSEIGG